MTIAQQLHAAADDVAAVEGGIYPSDDPSMLSADLHALADQVALLPAVLEPPPPPPPSPGVISAAIAGMAPGELRVVKLESSDAIFRIPQNSYDMLDWTPKAVWDAGTKQIIVGGRRVYNKVIAFSDDTGLWRSLALPPGLANDPNTFGHWYGEIENAAPGVIYLRGHRFTVATEMWEALPASFPSFNDGLGAMYAHFPNVGASGVMARLGDGSSAKKWRAWDIATQTRVVDIAGRPCGLHALVLYHPMHDKALMVGGSGTLKTAALVDWQGNATPAADYPGADVGMGGHGSWGVVHPAGCWIVQSGGQIFAYWPAANTWQALGPSPTAGAQFTNKYPKPVQGYSPDIVLIVSKLGLHAWRLPELVAP